MNLLLLLIICNGCKKDKADVPCLGSFSCQINGQPFETHGDFNCADMEFSLGTDSNGTLRVAGIDCRFVSNSFTVVVMEIYDFHGAGIYTLEAVSCGYVDDRGRPVPYNIEIEGEVKITGFVEDNYSEDWIRGYVEGTFWFTAYNKDTMDTVRVTNGQFCGRL